MDKEEQQQRQHLIMEDINNINLDQEQQQQQQLDILINNTNMEFNNKCH